MMETGKETTEQFVESITGSKPGSPFTAIYDRVETDASGDTKFDMYVGFLLPSKAEAAPRDGKEASAKWPASAKEWEAALQEHAAAKGKNVPSLSWGARAVGPVRVATVEYRGGYSGIGSGWTGLMSSAKEQGLALVYPMVEEYTVPPPPDAPAGDASTVTTLMRCIDDGGPVQT